jgi:hypothetical protein
VRGVVGLALVLSGCGCGEEEDRRDASLDSGTDASRNAAPDRDEQDGARDAQSDAPDAPGPCPEGETRVEPFAVPRDGEGAPCGDGCRQLTWNARGVRAYDVNGSRLAYASTDDVTVGILDLETEEEIGIPVEDPAGEELVLNGAVAVQGTTVVYSTHLTDGSKRGRLWRIDTATGCRRRLREFQSPGGASGDYASEVDLDGTTVVWYDQRWGSGQQDIFSYDLVTGIETRLTQDGCCAGETRISDGRVVYQGWADGPRGIHLIQLPAGKPSRVWLDAHEQSQPAIDGNRVVFTYQGDRPEYDRDIHGVDLETGEHFIVVEHEYYQNHADIHGDLVVWEDYRNDPDLLGRPTNIDIYARDLAAGKELPVITLPDLQTRPRVWGRTVFFRYRAPEADARVQIYAVELPP